MFARKVAKIAEIMHFSEILYMAKLPRSYYNCCK